MRIGFVGSQGTGKSTLLEAINKELNLTRANNPQRLFKENLENFALNGQTTYQNQCVILGSYAFELLSNKDYITDRTLIDVFAYSRASSIITKEECAKMEFVFSVLIKKYDYIFYTPIEFDIEADGVRDTNEAYRQIVDVHIRDIMNEHNVNYVSVKGSVEDRINLIKETLSLI